MYSRKLVGIFLDAGLTVQGAVFAAEMADLTEEALEGFRTVPVGADPGLSREFGSPIID